MSKDKGPSPIVLQWMVNTLFFLLFSPFLYYIEELYDCLRKNI